jgi:hypothetical protein
MARIKIKDGGDQDKVLDYLAPIVGRQDITTATVTGYCITTVAVPTITATDVVTTQLISIGSIGQFVMDVVITAATGFTVKTQNGSSGTLGYAVFHLNV